MKLYHPEAGTPFVDQIVNTADNVVRVARLTIAELTSAFAIKVRTQSIGRDDADVFLRQFRGDIASGKLEVFSIGEAEFAGAELLVDRYAFASRLRALDALQLAVALDCEIRSWWIILSRRIRYSVRLPDSRGSR